MTGSLALQDSTVWPALSETLAPWLVHQRWFGGKARTLQQVQVADAAQVDEQLWSVLADVAFADGHRERYHMPLVASEQGSLELGGHQLADALLVDEAAASLCRLALSDHTVDTVAGGVLHGRPVPAAQPDPSALGPPRRLGVEQSNSSVVFGEALFCKVFRRVETGTNPDVELTRALTTHGFAHVPAQVGALTYAHAGERSDLAVVSEFLPTAREGWSLASAEATRIRDGSEPDPGFRAAIGRLGGITGVLHRALADACGRHPLTREDRDGLLAEVRGDVHTVLAAAADRAPEASRPLQARRDELLARLDALARADDLGAAIRIHGDLHLGQVLHDEQRGWQILDFEGEPVRSLEHRRRPASPLRDVAGMLRSFDYAAGHAEVTAAGALGPWRDGLRSAYLTGYHDAVADTGLLPRDAGVGAELLALLELQKAVYELGYELANRPHWVPIPVGGILRILDEVVATPGRHDT